MLYVMCSRVGIYRDVFDGLYTSPELPIGTIYKYDIGTRRTYKIYTYTSGFCCGLYIYIYVGTSEFTDNRAAEIASVYVSVIHYIVQTQILLLCYITMSRRLFYYCYNL